MSIARVVSVSRANVALPSHRVSGASRRVGAKTQVQFVSVSSRSASTRSTAVVRASAEPAKFTNADAFKALDALKPSNEVSASANPFAGASANDPFAKASAPNARKNVGFFNPSVDEASLPSTSDADRVLARFDADQRKGTLPESNSKEGSKQCIHPPLRQSCRALASESSRVMLGICAEDAQVGIQTLKAWVFDLGLPRGKLHGLDVDGVEKPPPEGPVFVKYNSDSGDAFLSGYAGEFRGVLFTPELGDGAFRQYGYLPLELPKGRKE